MKHFSSNKGQVLASSPRAYAAQCPKSRSAALRLIDPKRRCPFLHPALQPKTTKIKKRIPSMWRFLILPDSLIALQAPAQVPDPFVFLLRLRARPADSFGGSTHFSFWSFVGFGSLRSVFRFIRDVYSVIGPESSQTSCRLFLCHVAFNDSWWRRWRSGHAMRGETEECSWYK